MSYYASDFLALKSARYDGQKVTGSYYVPQCNIFAGLSVSNQNNYSAVT
jgi:hypothetical protein